MDSFYALKKNLWGKCVAIQFAEECNTDIRCQSFYCVSFLHSYLCVTALLPP